MNPQNILFTLLARVETSGGYKPSPHKTAACLKIKVVEQISAAKGVAQQLQLKQRLPRLNDTEVVLKQSVGPLQNEPHDTLFISSKSEDIVHCYKYIPAHVNINDISLDEEVRIEDVPTAASSQPSSPVAEKSPLNSSNKQTFVRAGHTKSSSDSESTILGYLVFCTARKGFPSRSVGAFLSAMLKEYVSPTAPETPMNKVIQKEMEYANGTSYVDIRTHNRKISFMVVHPDKFEEIVHEYQRHMEERTADEPLATEYTLEEPLVLELPPSVQKLSFAVEANQFLGSIVSFLGLFCGCATARPNKLVKKQPVPSASAASEELTLEEEGENVALR